MKGGKERLRVSERKERKIRGKKKQAKNEIKNEWQDKKKEEKKKGHSKVRFLFSPQLTKDDERRDSKEPTI